MSKSELNEDEQRQALTSHVSKYELKLGYGVITSFEQSIIRRYKVGRKVTA